VIFAHQRRMEGDSSNLLVPTPPLNLSSLSSNQEIEVPSALPSPPLHCVAAAEENQKESIYIPCGRRGFRRCVRRSLRLRQWRGVRLCRGCR
jgi:hypothetical protein